MKSTNSSNHSIFTTRQYQGLYFAISSSLLCFEQPISGANPEILKRREAPCLPPWLADEENLGFRWSKKTKITLQTKSLAKHFFQYFQIFIYNESLPTKSYQFFKIYKSFYKQRGKTVIQQSMRKKNWKKLEFVLFNRLIYEALENGN